VVTLRNALRVLSTWSLAGLYERVHAVYWYYCEGASVKEVADRLGRGRLEVRGWIQRLQDSAIRDCVHRARAHVLLQRLLQRTYVDLLGTQSILYIEDGYVRCALCGRPIPGRSWAAYHVSRKHPKLVDRAVDRVVARLRSGAPDGRSNRLG